MPKIDFHSEHFVLETRARAALEGGFSDPARVIANYLESDAPISSSFRSKLAKALRGGIEGVKIAFPNSGPQSEIGQIETKLGYGRLVRAFKASGMTQDAFRHSGQWPNQIGRTKLQQAISFYNQFEEWYANAKETDERLRRAHDFAVECQRNDLEDQDEHFAFWIYCEDSLSKQP